MRSVLEISRRAKWGMAAYVLAGLTAVVALAVLVDATLALTAAALLFALPPAVALLPALGGWQPFAPRAELGVRLELAGPAMESARTGPRWIDVEAIVEEQLERAWSTAPPPPTPPSSTRHRAGRADGDELGRRMAQMLTNIELVTAAGAGVGRGLRERFAGRVERYEQELREWLDGIAQAVWERSCQLSVRMVVENASSRAPARELDADLELPPGLVLDDGPVDPATPPSRPSFEPGRSNAFLHGLGVVRLPRVSFSPPNPAELRDTPGGEGRRWSATGLPGVLHTGAAESSHRLELSIDTAGRHELRAIVRAVDLDRPVEETHVLEIPAEHAPARRLATLAELCEFLDIDEPSLDVV